MALSAGTRIGIYQVVSAIGAGGMGEVYRARDTQLDRDVALKILPEAVANDPERVMRFTREAKTLASLNHPNIAAIYGIEANALVMELVDGEDLAAVIARGPLPAAEALAIAGQMANALESAHELGIVHRDLKPANIKVRPDGTVKVLDFGLAKALEPDASLASRALQNSPTFTSPALMTRMGVVLGTAAYMAPEQARGRHVDKRADIWAFGVVLFEMLTGERPFGGESVPEMLAAVLKDDLPLDRLPVDTPPAVRRLIARCLEREPKLRLRDIGEARIGLAQDVDRESGVAGDAPRPRLLARLVAVTAAALALGVAGGWAIFARRVVPPAPAHYTVDLQAAGADVIMAAVSPDGRYIVVAAERGLWLRAADGTELRELVPGVQPRVVFWSPDSRWVAFATLSELSKVSVEGGAPARIADISRLPGPFNPMGGGVWLDSNAIVFTTGFTGLMQVSADGGEPDVLVAPASPTEDFHGVTALPSGGFITAAHDGATVDTLIALRGGTRTVVLRTKGDLAAPVYTPTGHLVFQRAPFGGLMAVAFDEKTLTVRGEPVSVLGPGQYASVSADGRTIVATSAPPAPVTEVALVDRGGRVVQPVGPARTPPAFAAPSLSSDGRRVALLSAQSGVPSAWVHTVGGGLATQVTEGEAVMSVSWVPGDSGLLVVTGSSWCLSGDCFSIERRSLAGEATTIGRGWSPDVSPDGTTLIYSKRTATEWDLAVKPLDGDAEPTIFQSGPGWQFGARFSPDGRYVAYTSLEAGRGDVYVARFPKGERRRVTHDGGYWPVWSRDGRRLYFARGTGIAAIDVATGEAFSVGTPIEIVPQGTVADLLATRMPAPFAVSADGTQFLVQRSLAEPGAFKPLAHVLLDWFSRR